MALLADLTATQLLDILASNVAEQVHQKELQQLTRPRQQVRDLRQRWLDAGGTGPQWHAMVLESLGLDVDMTPP